MSAEDDLFYSIGQACKITEKIVNNTATHEEKVKLHKYMSALLIVQSDELVRVQSD